MLIKAKQILSDGGCLVLIQSLETVHVKVEDPDSIPSLGHFSCSLIIKSSTKFLFFQGQYKAH